MTVKHIQIASDAVADLEDGKFFYSAQSQGVGEYFWNSLLSDIETLTTYAGIHTKEFGYYRMLSKRFPYSIYYEVEGDTVFVVAVLPERRDPVWIANRL
jgi:plasmid stabilization system protein ParE